MRADLELIAGQDSPVGLFGWIWIRIKKIDFFCTGWRPGTASGDQVANRKPDDKIFFYITPPPQARYKGFVYVLANRIIPDLVKIGYSNRDPEARVDELNGTGVPGKWEVAYYAFVVNAHGLEQAIHRELRDKRADKEFFRVSAFEAATIVRGWPGIEICHEFIGELDFAPISNCPTIQSNPDPEVPTPPSRGHPIPEKPSIPQTQSVISGNQYSFAPRNEPIPWDGILFWGFIALGIIGYFGGWPTLSAIAVVGFLINFFSWIAKRSS
ncbi:MAG: GIY-YIG nuclease family protein [Candidatus Krumholzibacteriia bacterium]